MNKKTIAILCSLLSIGNVVLTAILMNAVFGKGNAAPIWVEYFVLFYILVPMFYAYKLVAESFGKK